MSTEKRSRKTATLFRILMLVMSTAIFLSACSTNVTTSTTADAKTSESSKTSATTEATASVPAPDPDTVYEITYFLPGSHLVGDDLLIEKTIEKALNIKYKFPHLPDYIKWLKATLFDT